MIVAELEKIANEARQILDDLPKNERFDLGTRQGWMDLYWATVGKRFQDKYPAGTLERLRSLSNRWQYLYGRLAFEALTRPVWNT